MRRCAEAIARAVVEFLDAVILACLRSCFGARPRRGSGRRVRPTPDPPRSPSLSAHLAAVSWSSSFQDALVRGDRAAEVIWDEEGTASIFMIILELGCQGVLRMCLLLLLHREKAW